MTDISLEEVVFASEKFRDLLRGARAATLRLEFPTIQWRNEPPEIDWGFALMYASALNSTNSERAQSALLRVVTACLLSTESMDGHKAAAAALLERTGNRLSAELAEQRGHVGVDAWASTSSGMQLEVIRARLQYSLQLSNGVSLSINPFQDKFWSESDRVDWLSVSAPTSAGKSRIIRERFLEYARSHDTFTLVYLVPTRALIEEVSKDFRQEVPSGVGVFVLPWDPDLPHFSKRILVLTQERLHLIQELSSPFGIDLLFVDEAQSLGATQRGVLLQRTVERAVSENQDLRVVFASPLSSNPEILVAEAPDPQRASAFVSETVTVNQNLIWVEAVPRKPMRRSLSLIADGRKEDLGEFELSQRATTVPNRIALVAHALAGDSAGNVIYVNGADEAEKVAKAIFEQTGPGTKLPDVDINNLRSLVKSGIHEKYLLADVLERRVAFHYGNMPLMVRAEIERLFGEGKIHYLVCTSTLLEGVNLPCRSIFMRNPKKGRGNPLRESDFWNLAGRAGRWGKEFQGNIVCIDTDDDDLWPNLPLVRTRSPLSRAVETGLQQPGGILAFIRDTEGVHDDADAESLFSYLCNLWLHTQSLEGILGQVSLSAERQEIEGAVKSALENSTIPGSLIRRHAGISPTSMKRLFDAFVESGLPADQLELPLPEEADARPRFQEALVRLGETMTPAFGLPRGEHRRQWQLANLLVNWMRGLPLSRLIDLRIRATSHIAAATAIRDVMMDIETVARFQAPKYFSCYNDILTLYAQRSGVDRAPDRPDFTMLLELGVSRPSEVALMSLGLSRTATVALADYIGVDDWSTGEAVEWLAQQNLDGLGVPVLVQREILAVIEGAETRGRSR